MLDWGFTFLIILYCISILYLWWGWEQIPVVLTESITHTVAVIVPIRNEVKNILTLLSSLQMQTYTGDLKVIIIDDHSEDESYEMVKEFIKSNNLFKLIALEGKTGKKAAISKGISHTKAELILTVDGDCEAPSTWVQTMVNSFKENTQFVSGPVKFKREDGLFNRMQSIEFSSLIGSGASLIGWNRALMANGANMGFRKSAFTAVNGFEGNERTASGDDVFLLHKIAKQFPRSVAFAKHKGAIIETNAQSTARSFIWQRIRWASKWKAYDDVFTKSTAILVFALSLSLIIFPFLVGLNADSMFLWINLWIVKSFFDFYFIRQVSRFMGEKINVAVFLLLQFVYPFYVVVTALFSLQKSYVWKGRKVQ